MKRPSFAAKLVLAFGAGVIPGIVLAAAGPYLGTGKFATNNINWKYNGDSGYRAPNQNAAAKWSAVTDLNIFEVTDTSWHVLSNVAAYASTWTGYAYICSTNGSCDNSTAWNGTYSWCSARFNTNTVGSNTTKQQNTATHEMGHCWSLAHRDDSTSVMLSFQTSIIEPNQNDKDSVNTRY
jgi:hypothetical protein